VAHRHAAPTRHGAPHAVAAGGHPAGVYRRRLQPDVLPDEYRRHPGSTGARSRPEIPRADPRPSDRSEHPQGHPRQGTIASTKYTTVETTDRVQSLGDRLVDDADTRYDAARAVETYLESEKTYSLSDVPKPGDQIADQFLFEQEKGTASTTPPRW